MQISLRIRHLAPELCPMHFENAVSARPADLYFQQRISHQFAHFSLHIQYAEKIQKRNVFCKYSFSYDAASLRSLAPDADGVSDSPVRVQLPSDRRANKFDRGFPSVDNYEVTFVVYGYISNKNDNIGEIECNGSTKSCGVYVLHDARIYFNIMAKTPQEAYQHGLQLMISGAADFGDVTVEDWHLEHVACGDCYWYKEDMKD